MDIILNDNKKVKSFRDLFIWQKSMSLVTEIYKYTKILPENETFGLVSQMRRCAVSVPSNIAEGYGRNTNNEFIRFLHVASGSLYELQTQVEISLNLEYFDQNIFNTLFESMKELDKMINSFTVKLINKKNQ